MSSTSTPSTNKWRTTFQINILETSFTILTNEVPDHLNKIHTYFKEEIEKMQDITKMNDPLKLSILTGFAIVNDLLQERAKAGHNTTGNTESVEVEKIAMRLIAEMDDVIKEPEK